MRGVWIVTMLAVATPAVARDRHSQYSAIWTPSSEMLERERRQHCMSPTGGALIGASGAMMALARRRKPQSYAPPPMLRRWDYDVNRGNGSEAPLSPNAPMSRPTTYRPAPPVPLEVRLPAH